MFANTGTTYGTVVIRLNSFLLVPVINVDMHVYVRRPGDVVIALRCLLPCIGGGAKAYLSNRNRTSDRWISVDRLQSTALPTELSRDISMLEFGRFCGRYNTLF